MAGNSWDREVTYTPVFTGFGTPPSTSIDFYWSHVGNRIKIQGYFQSGTPSAALAGIGFPGSYVSDTALIKTGVTMNVGTMILSINGAGSYYCLCGPGQSGVSIGIQSAGANSITAVAGNAMGISSGTQMSVNIDAPISGWNI